MTDDVPKKLGTELRKHALDRHERIRDALRGVLEAASAAAEREKGALMRLRRTLRALEDAVRQHAGEDQALVAPVLRELDAWGPIRVEQLAEDHRKAEAIVGSIPPDAPEHELVGRARSLVRPLLRLLKHEERTLLSKRLFRDDVIAIDQEDG